MSQIDFDALLREVSPDAPCGPDLSYDTEYQAMERAAAGSPERQVGDSVLPAEEPDWRDVAQRCRDLLARSKDLRLVMQLILAQMKVEGLPGLHSGLQVLRRLVEQHWPNVHPQLDPEDNNDPTARVHLIAQLSPPPGAFSDPMQFRQRLREATLCNSKQFGRFSLRDMAVATGQLMPTDPSAPKLEMAQIEAAFDDTPADELQMLYTAADGSIEEIKGLQSALLERAGADKMPDLKEILGVLNDARGQLRKVLEKRGVLSAESGNGVAGAEGQSAAGGSGEIRSTRDVILAIDRICDYYSAYEPSSPIPLLLRRAQRLVSKSFMDIIKDLTPSSIQQIELISGSEQPPPT